MLQLRIRAGQLDWEAQVPASTTLRILLLTEQTQILRASVAVGRVPRCLQYQFMPVFFFFSFLKEHLKVSSVMVLAFF